jgi:hypothetical protein
VSGGEEAYPGDYGRRTQQVSGDTDLKLMSTLEGLTVRRGEFWAGRREPHFLSCGREAGPGAQFGLRDQGQHPLTPEGGEVGGEGPGARGSLHAEAEWRAMEGKVRKEGVWAGPGQVSMNRGQRQRRTGKGSWKI